MSEASKETAAQAIEALDTIGKTMPGMRRILGIEFDIIGRFLKAAQSKLPRKASYDKQRIRRRDS